MLSVLHIGKSASLWQLAAMACDELLVAGDTFWELEDRAPEEEKCPTCYQFG